MVKNGNGLLLDGVEVRRRVVYFEQVLNVKEVKEANTNVAGDWQMDC